MGLAFEWGYWTAQLSVDGPHANPQGAEKAKEELALSVLTP